MTHILLTAADGARGGTKSRALFQGELPYACQRWDKEQSSPPSRVALRMPKAVSADLTTLSIALRQAWAVRGVRLGFHGQPGAAWKAWAGQLGANECVSVCCLLLALRFCRRELVLACEPVPARACET